MTWLVKSCAYASGRLKLLEFMDSSEAAKKYFLPIAITLLLTIYQLVRIIGFINVYGGIEHDGGWMLSISRSLAEQGTYTTMVSTIVDPAAPGDINIDQKFDIQAGDGRIWFFTGNGIGPASIIPDALALKIFGTGFWALRAGPLIFYTLALLLAAYILYQLAGVGAIILFHAFLFCYPHISIFLSYEAMGEVPGLFYILGAYLAFAAVIQKQPRPWFHFLGAGLVIGLALNAKLITLWSISGMFIWAGWLWLAGLIRSGQQAGNPESSGGRAGLRLSELLWLGGGAVGLILLWELVHLVILTSLTNFELYLRQAQQRLQFILDDGSGLGLRIHSGSEFFWDKFFLLSEVAHPQRWVTALIFGAILGGGLLLAWPRRACPSRQNLLVPIWLGWLANTLWFVAVAKTGWPRHFWFGLVLAMLLLSAITAALIQLGLNRPTAREAEREGSPQLKSRLPASYLVARSSLITGIMLLVLIGWGFISQPHIWGFFLPDEIVPYWQQKQVAHKYDAGLPWIIIPRAAQAEVVDYIKQLPPEAQVYYPGAHKSAEIPPQTGRIHYPLNRRKYVTPHPADIALIGPSLISPWKDPIQRQDLLDLVEQECPNPLLKNDFYMICPIEANLSQQ